MADVKEERGFKRKRKKSFLTKQKQYGKKGRFGQGVELSEDSYQYFIRILEVIKSSKDSPEDMEMLASNVVEEMAGKEVDTCSNQLASRVVEELLAFAPDDKLLALGNIFVAELRLVISDPYSSHVLQRLVITLAKRILLSKEPSQAIIDQFKTCFVRIAMFALNNVEDFIFDTYANHVLRTLFACANGHAVKLEVGQVDLPDTTVGTIPDEFEELATSCVKKIVSWPQFNDLTNQVLTSGCLQALVISVKNNSKLNKKLLKKVVEACESSADADFTDEKHQPFLHLIEASIVAAPPKIFNKIYEPLFKGKLKALALTKTCNFVVQKLLLHCQVKETFDEMFSEIDDSFPALLDGNFSGVLLAIAKSCNRLKTRQGDFTKVLLASLHCDEPPDRQLSSAPVICCLTRFENYSAQSKVHLHGSLIMQQMLHFTKPIRLVTSLLAMAPEPLITLLCDPRGCHVTDAYIASPFVGEKSREKLFKKLQRHYVTLAASKHGSRSFDAIWGCLNSKQRTLVMEELKAQQSAVVATLCGRVIASKTRLDLFRQDKESWIKQAGDKPKASNGGHKNKKELKS